MAMITFPFHPVVGVWEVLCSAASTGIKEGPSHSSGYTGGKPILLQLDIVPEARIIFLVSPIFIYIFIYSIMYLDLYIS